MNLTQNIKDSIKYSPLPTQSEYHTIFALYLLPLADGVKLPQHPAPTCGLYSLSKK